MTEQEKQNMQIVEDALRDTSLTLDYLLSIINNVDEVKKKLFEFNVSVPFVIINHSCARDDRNVEHLSKAWENHFAAKKLSRKTTVMSYQDFCLTRTYEATKDMSLDELGRYHDLMGMTDDCELDVVYQGLVLYGPDQDYYIGRAINGDYELVLGNQEYCLTDVVMLEKVLYDYYLAEADQS